MARTKHTVLKSTGGPAKRGQLPTFKVIAGPAGKPIIKRAFSKALPPAFSATKDVGKDIATKVTTDVTRSMSEPSFWNDYCILCRDGASLLYDCSHCPRTLCQECLVIPKESVEKIKGSDVSFTCPGCHEMREKGKHTSPYHGFEDAQGTPILAVPATIEGHIELTSRSQICNSPILILYLILDGVNPSGSPARIMRNVLEPYVAGESLQYHEVVFDIGTLEKAERHTKSMKALADRVKDIPFERVEIFVHTRSETIRGDLWGGFEDAALVGKQRKKLPNFDDPIAYTVDDFFRGVFVGGIEGYLKGANLWMLVCGQMVQDLDAFAALKARVTYHEVERVFVFGAERFHASLVAAFTLAYTERVLVEGFEVRDTMPNLLAVSPQLAMHTSVILIQLIGAFRRRPITIIEYTKPVRLVEDKVSMTVTTYTFFDENRRPWGNVLPYQSSVNL